MIFTFCQILLVDFLIFLDYFLDYFDFVYLVEAIMIIQ